MTCIFHELSGVPSELKPRVWCRIGAQYLLGFITIDLFILHLQPFCCSSNHTQGYSVEIKPVLTYIVYG